MSFLRPFRTKHGADKKVSIPGSVRVVSKRKGGIEARSDESVVDVDRENPVLGNTFILHDHRDDKERALVIGKYKEKLNADWSRRGPMRKAIEDLAVRVKAGEKLALRCWCAPKWCHAELIAEKVAEVAHIDYVMPTRLHDRGEQKKQLGLF